MSTALALMNRLRAKAREDQITSFPTDDERHAALISELNQAIRIVLEERTWNFQARSDGSLLLRPAYQDTTGTANTAASALTLGYVATTPETANLNGEFTTSFVFTGNAGWANTTFDLLGCRLSGATNVLGTLPAMPVSAIFSTGWLLYIYQYALPTTVRSVLEIWHQERDLEIYQENEHDFRRLVPRPDDEFGNDPKVAFVGGTLVTTVSNAATSTGVERNAIRIWPIPGTAALLNYRYIYRNADLVAATDTLNGVPLTVEDLIVQLAYARQLQSIQADVQRGLAMEGQVMSEIGLKHRNSRFDPYRERSLRSLDQLGRKRSGLLRTYDTVPGWP